MEDQQDKPVSSDQVEQRSLTSTFLNGVAAGAGGAVGVGVVTQGSQAIEKLKDKITAKDKD